MRATVLLASLGRKAFPPGSSLALAVDPTCLPPGTFNVPETTHAASFRTGRRLTPAPRAGQQLLWNALAERNVNSAFNSRGASKAVSRSACRRSPNGPGTIRDGGRAELRPFRTVVTENAGQ